jgi:predicted DCC family thiol-disulfide oxidoreductase YuxK
MGATHSLKHPTILFDGVCNLCNGSVLFIIKRDPHSKFRFSSLQSELGTKLLTEFEFPQGELSSVLLIKDERLYQKSNAALEIAKQLSGLWPVLYIFKIVPLFIRNGIYDWIASNRYRWFGKKDACMIPTPELKARFVE